SDPLLGPPSPAARYALVEKEERRILLLHRREADGWRRCRRIRRMRPFAAAEKDAGFWASRILITADGTSPMTESASGLWPAVSSSLELIGRTPMLEVTRLDTGLCRLFLKLENQNPGGSIKD